MSDPRADWSRREFVGGLTLGWTAGLLGLDLGQAAAEPPPETTKLHPGIRSPHFSTFAMPHLL